MELVKQKETQYYQTLMLCIKKELPQRTIFIQKEGKLNT